MGQKVNPNIFRLGKTKNWKSKYSEKKSTEISLYAFNDLEIRKFTYKFFKNKGLMVDNCKTNYLNESSSLHIFISYYLTSKSSDLINDLIKHQNIELEPIKMKKQINKRKNNLIKSYIKNYIKYKKLNINKSLGKFTLKSKKNQKVIKNVLDSKNSKLKRKRLNLLKYYKLYINLKNQHNFKSIYLNFFLEQFFKSLELFLNKKLNIFITFQSLTQNFKKILKKGGVVETMSQRLIRMEKFNKHKFKRNYFFFEGLEIMAISTTTTHSSDLLAHFIASQLAKLKRHNFFLRFIRNSLRKLLAKPQFSQVKGIKIKVKGRFNGRRRGRTRIFNIKDSVCTSTINSKIDYSEATSFSSNGTFGVKVWRHFKN